MNRLRTHKLKLNGNDNTVNNSNGINNINDNTNSNSNSNANGGSNNGLLNKLTKRYSTLSSKITRRHNAGRKGNSPQKAISGSYDMTGTRSEDHRLEIGAPILISTTTLDAERLDVSEARLRQIGGGIATANKAVRIISVNSSPKMPSSSSENDDFVDAFSTTPMTEDTSDEDKFVLAPEIQKMEIYLNDIDLEKDLAKNESLESSSPPEYLSTMFSAAIFNDQSEKLTKKTHSKSAQNLHRTEIKVLLQRTPSVKLVKNPDPVFDLPQFQHLPKLPELYDTSKSSNTFSDTEGNDADKESSSPSILNVDQSLQQTKSEPNTPANAHEEMIITGLSQQQHFKSVDSLDLHRQASKRRRKLFDGDNSMDCNGSKSSLTSQNSTLADYDLKSVSCQSLNTQTLFVSIDELNDLTRQINEGEDFSQDLDLEYCQHRDNLKPSERRITLLKNKNSRLISFNHNKEKLKKGWHDVKHWIGGERSKLKEVVSKQANLQRTGTTSRLNLSNAECRNSPSLHGSVLLQSGSANHMLDTTDVQTIKDSSFRLNRSSGRDNDISCENLPRTEIDVEDLESLCTQTPGEDVSPAMKQSIREGQNGFEELRRYIKQGGDFGKELILILQERVDSEMLYSKSLSKMANKLNRACRELPGSIADAWRGVATEMESRSDIHRQLSTSLTEEIVKPLKAIVDGHHKTRKSVEGNVDKAARVLSEWRVSEAKSKKASHTAARENEKLQDAMLDVRIQKSPSIAILHQGANKAAAEKEIKSAEKDCAKLDNKRKKAEEAVKRADVEYYTLCLRAERARVDWEVAVLRGSSVLQNIENQRLVTLKNCVANYVQLTGNMNPVLDTLVQRLQPQIDGCNVVKDMQVVKNIRRNSEGPSEQLLPDFYCEHTTLAMNRERRKHALIKLSQLVKADLERERRSRNGLKGLSQSMSNQENQNITDKLYHIRSMLTYLEGARFKLHSALLELDHKPRTSHPLAQHIQVTRDRTGLQQSVLKVPLWLKNHDNMTSSTALDENTSYLETHFDTATQQASPPPTNTSCTDLSKESSLFKNFYRSKSSVEGFSQPIHTANKLDKSKTIPASLLDDRGQADGGSNQQDSDFDEFSSEDEDDEVQPTTPIEKINTKLNGMSSTKTNFYQNSSEIHDQQQHPQETQFNNVTTPKVLSRCKALYSYTPKLYDELELNPGDIIEVHAKQEDGWWLGALRNQVGIFPATYVEELA